MPIPSYLNPALSTPANNGNLNPAANNQRNNITAALMNIRSPQPRTPGPLMPPPMMPQGAPPQGAPLPQPAGPPLAGAPVPQQQPMQMPLSLGLPPQQPMQGTPAGVTQGY